MATRSAAAAATAVCLPPRLSDSPQGAAAFLREPMPASQLESLATAAAEAARRAGASYADVRTAERHQLEIIANGEDQPTVLLAAEYAYGLRVLVDGTWNFVHGTVPSIDAMTIAAKRAVTTARSYSGITRNPMSLAPAPVVTGTWEMPIQLDPFTVPLQDHAALMAAYRDAGNRVKYARTMQSVKWTRETRVFASSEGSLVSQQTCRSDPSFFLLANFGMGGVFLKTPGFEGARAGGYETYAIAGLPDRITAAADEAARLAALPRGTMDVGRYPLVMDGTSVSVVFTRSVSAALELDRVLGAEADASGTSYLAPVDEYLGNPIVSPLLSATVQREMPSVDAAKWDDEGVECTSYPIVTNGKLVDYHTSRATAPALQERYAKLNRPYRSNGCAVSPNVANPVLVRMPYTSVAPSATPKRLQDLCDDMGRGILVRDTIALSCDPTLASGALFGGGTMMLEIVRGKPVRRLAKNGLMFQSKKLWNGIIALGDATTVQEQGDNTFGGGIPKGMPWQASAVGGRAPAALFKEINVIAMNR